MAKKIKIIVKLSLIAGKATPAPPIGPSLGQHGINLLNFCKEYNALTNDQVGNVVPVEVTIFEDKTFSFILKTAPTAFLLLKACNLKKGSSKPLLEKIGTLKKHELVEIAKVKLNDLNTNDMEKAIKIVIGTAKNLGLKVEV